MRDLILKIVTALEAIKTAVETIAVNTTPADNSGNDSAET